MNDILNDPKEIESRIKSVLRDLDVNYEWIEIGPEFADTANFCEKYGFPLEKSVNTIIVASKRGEKTYSASALLATDRLDVNHKVKQLMNVSRLSFANADDTMALTNMITGGVTLFGLPDSIPVYIDSKILSSDYVIIGGGSRSGKIKLPPQELLKIPTALSIDSLSL